MKVIAIDQSYTSSGIIVFNDEKMHYVERYVSDKTKDIFDRAWEITEHIRAIALNCKPDVVALEGLAFNAKGNRTRDLAGLQFLIVAMLRSDGYNVIVYAPGTVKKVATGKGNSPKTMLLEVLPKDVRKKFDDMNLKKTTGLLDLTDAYWIGITAIKQPVVE
jgi:Holliday junction resolvasome RuvABC endonuclease subunit